MHSFAKRCRGAKRVCFSTEVPEGSESVGSRGGKHVLRDSNQVLFVTPGGKRCSEDMGSAVWKTPMVLLSFLSGWHITCLKMRAVSRGVQSSSCLLLTSWAGLYPCWSWHLNNQQCDLCAGQQWWRAGGTALTLQCHPARLSPAEMAPAPLLSAGCAAQAQCSTAGFSAAGISTAVRLNPAFTTTLETKCISATLFISISSLLLVSTLQALEIASALHSSLLFPAGRWELNHFLHPLVAVRPA